MDSIALHRLLKCSHTFFCADPTEIPVLSSHHSTVLLPSKSPVAPTGTAVTTCEQAHGLIRIAITTPERLLVALIPLGSLFMALIPMRDPMVASPRRWRTG
jgi:hypothetical protein